MALGKKINIGEISKCTFVFIGEIVFIELVELKIKDLKYTLSYSAKCEQAFIDVRALLSPQTSCFGFRTFRSCKIN